MMWFEKLMGFREESPEQVRENIMINDRILKSRINGQELICGELETPSLSQLRERVHSSQYQTGKISIREVIANVQDLHANQSYAHSLFQVASQFNLLEMVSSRVTPEMGVGIYENDRTQGPACAIAAGAGTIYRNYFAVVNNRIGQCADHQIDCLADLGVALGNQNNRLWNMKNGYALASHHGLIEIRDKLRASSEPELDRLRQLLKIGIQWNTQVTIRECQHTVSQVYCSALPIAYSPNPASLWTEFAQLILEASYEATICTAILNSAHNGNRHLFLTLIGGGVFGNDINWIINAIKRAVNLYHFVELDIAIVSYRSSQPSVQKLISQINS